MFYRNVTRELRACSTLNLIRSLTTTEVSTALRPFYFSVHPDLFGKHPDIKAINENSLKQLSAILEMLQANKTVTPTYLEFFLRETKSDKFETGVGLFRHIKIHLKERDVRNAVLTILKSSGLNTEYVDQIPKVPRKMPTMNGSFANQSKSNQYPRGRYSEGDNFYTAQNMKRKIKEMKESFNLSSWLEENHANVVASTNRNRPLQDDVRKLSKTIAGDLGITELRWDCGWNETHQRGCLLSFKLMTEQHPEIRSILKGRIVVFAPFTGVSLDGHIMLNSGEVRHNWLDLIKNVKTYDATLTRLPAFEKAVSQVLRNIKVGRRKFMPKIMAGEYESNLMQITTSLSDYLSTRKYPESWPQSLEDYELVVETAAGPMMVSPTGQFIVPSSIPGVLLVSFITSNLDEAKLKGTSYRQDKEIEKMLHKKCIEDLKLLSLRKEDNVTPDLMIQCCKRLLENKNVLSRNLEGVQLNIATYYSILTDGLVCIPWNFVL